MSFFSNHLSNCFRNMMKRYGLSACVPLDSASANCYWGCCAEVIVCERGGEVFIYVSDYFDCVGGVV